jgi:hypothetical protein
MQRTPQHFSDRAGGRSMDWRKSSYSAENGNCAEAAAVDGDVMVRDTQDRDGVTLAIPAPAWRTFAARLRAQAAK